MTSWQGRARWPSGPGTGHGRHRPATPASGGSRLSGPAHADEPGRLPPAGAGTRGALALVAHHHPLLAPPDQAQSAGEFRRLPADKYSAWKVLNVVFTTEKGIEFST